MNLYEKCAYFSSLAWNYEYIVNLYIRRLRIIVFCVHYIWVEHTVRIRKMCSICLLNKSCFLIWCLCSERTEVFCSLCILTPKDYFVLFRPHVLWTAVCDSTLHIEHYYITSYYLIFCSDWTNFTTNLQIIFSYAKSFNYYCYHLKQHMTKK